MVLGVCWGRLYLMPALGAGTLEPHRANSRETVGDSSQSVLTIAMQACYSVGDAGFWASQDIMKRFSTKVKANKGKSLHHVSSFLPFPQNCILPL